MASISMPPFLLLLTGTLFLPSTTATSTARNHTGFTLKLIHRYALESSNLTTTDLYRRHLHRHRAAIRPNPTYKPLDRKLRPPFVNYNWDYAVEIPIGTPPITLYLLLDIGSDVTWTQCHPCNPYFPQDPPYFLPPSSSSYAVLPCTDRRCRHHRGCIEEHDCDFSIEYADGGKASGVYATENLTLRSSSPDPVVVPDFVLGCSTKSSESMFRSTRIAGILGMNREPPSFLRQTESTTGGRFSYCMVPLRKNLPSYLSFGDDIPPLGRKAHTIPFVMQPNAPPHYYLDMVGIGFDGKDLGIPSKVFSIKPDGTGGTVIDTGTEFSDLVSPAFWALIAPMDRHLKKLGYAAVQWDVYPRCYRKQSGGGDDIRKFPKVQFHFRGRAELELFPSNLFTSPTERRDLYCLTLAEGSKMTIIGARQMGNFRFVFDLRRNQLSFAPEVCGK